MKKRYKDSLYLKKQIYDTVSHIPVDETKQEKRVREKSEEKLESLILLYHELKKNKEYLIPEKCKLNFTPKFHQHISELDNEWIKFCNFTYNINCRKNPKLDSFMIIISADIVNSKEIHWTSVFEKGLKQYGLKNKGFENLDITKNVEEVIFDIICKKKKLRHFNLWKHTVKYPLGAWVVNVLAVWE